MHAFRRGALVLGLMTGGFSLAGEAPVALLPDMITNQAHLLDTIIVDNIVEGRIHLRLSNGTPNIGDGPMHVFGVPPETPGPVQDIMQRIFYSDGNFVDRPAGQFVYHPDHGHIHVEDWAQYRLRVVTQGDGVGAALAEGKKTSFCLLDSAVFNAFLPGVPDAPVYTDCGDVVQGISVGYEDVYQRFLPDQWIDITGLPDGEYWLESEVDPLDHVLELDETNNVARVKVELDHNEGPPAPPSFLERLLALFRQFIDIIRSLFGLG